MPGDDPATFKQRMALTNMHNALGWSTVGIRDMTIAEASKAIDKAKKHIDENGFPQRENRNSNPDGFGDDAGW